MIVIRLEDVSLTFRVRSYGRISLKEYLVQGKFRRRQEHIREVRALQQVSLTISSGERVGIIGHNGAGKSTLLKLLAGVYLPSQGRREVQGQISSLFEISLGFEQDASGWDNIMYRGYLQGETPRSIREKMQLIADFSELGEFLDMPVRYYSTGMMVRLAFAISTAIDPDILLIDEVLGAGDMAFQIRARERMQELIDKARVVVIVTHDTPSLSRLCDRVIWLDHGRVRMQGPVDEVVAAYTQQFGDQRQPRAA
jgi:lipopolysaccharide transport system ATP-binding protein